MDTKRILSDMLAFYKQKVDNDECSLEEMESLKNAFSDNVKAYGTVEDIAKLYGQSESNVRNLINRRSIPKDMKPKRRVLYRFDWLVRHIPDNWRKR